MTKLVAYYRVSTQKQGASGLGLEAQEAAVENYARSIGAEIIGKPFVEVESGKRADRPELQNAIAYARRCKAVLCVAKLDRLARNVQFLATLIRSDVEFVAVDNPQATKLVLHILAAVAESEAEAISQRTRDALAAYKARGGLLGAGRPECRNLTADAMAKGRQAGCEARIRKANEAYSDLYGMLAEMRQAGHTLQQIADKLNGEGFTTRRGRPWNRMQVKLVLERAERIAG